MAVVARAGVAHGARSSSEPRQVDAAIFRGAARMEAVELGQLAAVVAGPVGGEGGG